MAIQTQIVTGRLSEPDGDPITTGSVRFTLSRYDATDNGVIAASRKVDAPLESDGSIALELWPNTAGLRGTTYVVELVSKKGYVVETYGRIQVGEAGPYSLADLIRTELPPATTSYWSTLTQVEYDAAIAAKEAAEISETNAATSAAQAALYDGPWLANSAAIDTDTSLSYGPGASGVSEGDYVRTRADGFSYQVAAEGATDHHLTTAGGVKLRRVEESFKQSAIPSGSSGWTPPAMPGASGLAGHIINHNTALYADYIALWEDLRASYPQYITRESLGLDESGTFTVWRYTLDPGTSNRTVILDGGIHGFERISITGLFLLIREIVENWQTHAGLAHLRWNCKLVVIPVVNPWGCENASRYNTNGVDLNRNFGYNWATWNDALDGQPKGAAAFSEVEAQYLRDTIIANSEAAVHFSFHDLTGPGDAQFTAYGPDPLLSGEAINIAERAYQFMRTSPAEDSLIFYGRMPSVYNWSTSEYGMISCNPEANTDGTGADKWTPAAMTRAVGFWGNMLIEAARKNKVSTKTAAPWVRRATWSVNGTDTNPLIASSSYTLVPGFTLVERISGAGLVKFTGHVEGTMTGMLSGEKGLVNLCPAFGHTQNILSRFSESRTELWETYAYGFHDERMFLPFEAVIPVGGDYVPVSPGVNELKASIRMKVGNVSNPNVKFEVTRYYASLEFTPSDHPNKFTWYRADTRLASGEGAMEPVAL